MEFAAFAFMFIEPAVIADSEPIVRLPPEKLNALLENTDFDGKDEFYGLIDEISKEI